MDYEIDKNVTLKPLKAAFAQELFQQVDANRSYVRQWLAWVDDTKDVEDSRKFIQESIVDESTGKIFIRSIWHRDKLIGIIDLHNISKKNKSAEIGYWMDAAYQGKGFMTLSCKKLLEIAFSELGLHRVEIKAAENNERSRAIAHRLHFTQEGTFRDAEWLYDHYVNLIVYSILSTEQPK